MWLKCKYMSGRKFSKKKDKNYKSLLTSKKNSLSCVEKNGKKLPVFTKGIL